MDASHIFPQDVHLQKTFFRLPGATVQISISLFFSVSHSSAILGYNVVKSLYPTKILLLVQYGHGFPRTRLYTTSSHSCPSLHFHHTFLLLPSFVVSGEQLLLFRSKFHSCTSDGKEDKYPTLKQHPPLNCNLQISSIQLNFLKKSCIQHSYISDTGLFRCRFIFQRSNVVLRVVLHSPPGARQAAAARWLHSCGSSTEAGREFHGSMQTKRSGFDRADQMRV